MENSLWRLLNKLRIKLPYDPAIPLSDIYPKNTEVLIQKDTCTPMFIAALPIVGKIWNLCKCPMTEERLKMNGILLQDKKE